DSIADLLLEDEEEETIHLGVDVFEREIPYVNYYVGTFLTSSVVNFQVIKSTLVNVWRPIGGDSVSDLGHERFLFHFYFKVDVVRVKRNGPWTFNSHLLVLHPLKEGDDRLSLGHGESFCPIKAHSPRQECVSDRLSLYRPSQGEIWLRRANGWWRTMGVVAPNL
ncbi:hypothetical protein Goarm_004959, partial [Gossypium armourianum]|nr:hypothetical protein [Gossypium armourianum]